MSRDPGLRPSSATELTGRLRAALLTEATVQFPAPVPPVAPVVPVAPVAPVVPAAASAAPAVDSAGPAAPAAAAVPVSAPRVVKSDRSPAPAARRLAPPARPPRLPAIGETIRASRSSNTESARSRRGPLVAGLLALAATAVVLAVILSGGSTPKPLNTANAAHHSTRAAGRSHTSARTTGTTASARTTGTTAGSAGASSPGARTTGGSNGVAASDGSSGAAATGSPSSSTGSSSSLGATPSSAASGSPVSSVESFYGLAASHRYPEAWALADPAFRAQLAGFPSFESGQAGDRSITFNSAKVTSQSDTAATVAVTTTSVRTDGTKHCTGTVDLLRAGSSAAWLLHQIHINCS